MCVRELCARAYLCRSVCVAVCAHVRKSVGSISHYYISIFASFLSFFLFFSSFFLSLSLSLSFRRIDEILYFVPFSKAELLDLVKLQLEKWRNKAHEVGVRLA